MFSRCFIYLGACLLFSMCGCKSLPDTSEAYWWCPFGPPQFENRLDSSITVYLDAETAEALEREYLIQLLEKNNRLLEKLADER